MSVFRPQSVPCPACGSAVEFQVADSVNGTRRPDLRDEILSDTFQRGQCTECETAFRFDPQLTYFDVERKQWILIRPADRLPEWGQLEAQAREIHAEAFGPEASAAARAIGATLQVRVTFGWAAAREKLLCAAHGIDDVELELLKLGLIRWLGDPLLADDVELRLLEADDQTLGMAWTQTTTGKLLEPLSVPRALYDDVTRDEQRWANLRSALKSGTFVDVHRLLVEPV